MRKAKGQFVSFITVFTLLFITFGTVFGSLIITDSFERQIEFNSGDISKIAETRLKVEAFENRAPKEVNYTSNNISQKKTYWNSDDGVPSIETAQDNFLSELHSSLENQISPAGCNGPSIESIELGDSLTEFSFELSGDSINCSSDSTEVSIPTDLGGSFSVNNSKNRYISALNYSSNYTRNLKTRLDSFDSFSQTGVGDSSTCNGGSLQDAREEAKEDAESEVASDVMSQAESEESDGDEISIGWIDLNIGSVDVSGRCSYESDSYSDSELCYDPCKSRDENGSCEGGYGDPGTEWDTECRLDTDNAEISFSILDREFEIITVNGKVNPEFSWAYTYLN